MMAYAGLATRWLPLARQALREAGRFTRLRILNDYWRPLAVSAGSLRAGRSLFEGPQ
jgi:hypothetical protein